MEKKKLYIPIQINGMELKNRLVRSATYEAMATKDGMVTEKLIKVYSKLAKGGIGLIIQGYAYVQERGRALASQTGISTDDHIQGLEKLVSEVHNYDTKIALQLVHGGRQSRPDLIGNQAPMAPSIISADSNTVEMTIDDIHETINAFGESARRAKEAGFDAVQVHAGHGYLIAQFLSPYTNQRNDEWGGSPENRMRFVIKIYEKIRDAVGQNYPVLIKMNADEGIENGLTPEEARIHAKVLSRLGIDAIELSGGNVRESPFTTCRGDIAIDIITRNAEPLAKKRIEEHLFSIKDSMKFEEAYWLPYADEIKKVIGDVPLILVGGMKYPQTMEWIAEEGKADLISLCRPLIREPQLPNQMINGRKDPVKCSFCNRCSTEVVFWAKPLKCYNLA